MNKQKLKQIQDKFLKEELYHTDIIADILEALLDEPKAVDVTPPVRPTKWRAERGGAYFCISSYGIVEGDNDLYQEEDCYRYQTGNYYQTKEEAEQALEVIKAKGRLSHSHYALTGGFNSALSVLTDNLGMHSRNGVFYFLVNRTSVENLYYFPKLDLWFPCENSKEEFIKENEEDLKTVFGLTQSIND